MLGLKLIHFTERGPWWMDLTMHHFVMEMCTFLLQNGALLDMGLVHCGIGVIGLLYVKDQSLKCVKITYYISGVNELTINIWSTRQTVNQSISSTPKHAFLYKGLFHQHFSRNSNSTEISSCCNLSTDHQMMTNFCTCNESTAVMPCATFFTITSLESRWEQTKEFHQIWIVIEKTSVKWVPEFS